jgi:hypothetical protein
MLPFFLKKHVAHPIEWPLSLIFIRVYPFCMLSPSFLSFVCFHFQSSKGKITIDRTVHAASHNLYVGQLTQCKTEQDVQGHNH